MNLIIVGCGARKLGRAAPAGSLYTGTLFRLGLAYAQQLPGTIRILSAKHGLIAPDRWIQPYDLRLKDLGRDGLCALRDRVAQELHLWLGNNEAEITILAGREYVDLVRNVAAKVWPVQPRWTVVDPLAGMTLPARMRYLKLKLNEVQE